MFAKICPPHAEKWTNLQKYALETDPGAGCEKMHSVKITLSPYKCTMNSESVGGGIFEAMEKEVKTMPHGPEHADA